MGDLETVKLLLTEVSNLIEQHIQAMKSMQKSAGASAGVVGSTSFAGQFDPSSAAVLLTDGPKKKKKQKVEKDDASGLITTSDGKKIKLTGLSDKEKDEYLFGRAKIKKAINDLSNLINQLEDSTRRGDTE